MNSVPNVGSHPSHIFVCQLRKFRGTPSENFARWLARFELMCTADNVNSTVTKANILPTYLTDSALEFYFTIDIAIRANYAALIVALTNEFMSPERTKSWQAQISARKQEVGETVSNYQADIRRMGQKVYPNMPENTRQNVLLGHFTDGLRPHYRKKVSIRFPANFNAAVHLAQTFEMLENISPEDESDGGEIPQELLPNANQQEFPKPEVGLIKGNCSLRNWPKSPVHQGADGPSGNSGGRAPQGITNLASGLTNQHEKGSEIGWPKYPTMVEIECWRCHEKGHIARDCPLGTVPKRYQFPKKSVGGLRLKKAPKTDMDISVKKSKKYPNPRKKKFQDVRTGGTCKNNHFRTEPTASNLESSDSESDVRSSMATITVSNRFVARVLRTDIQEIVPSPICDPNNGNCVSDNHTEERGSRLHTKIAKIWAEKLNKSPEMPNRKNQYANVAPQKAKPAGNGIITFIHFLNVIFYCAVIVAPWFLNPKALIVLLIVPWVTACMNSNFQLAQNMNLAFPLIWAIYRKTNSAIKNLPGILLQIIVNLTKSRNMMRILILSALLHGGSTEKPAPKLDEIPYIAPNPMICGTSTLKDLWKIPRQEPCKIVSLGADQTPRTTKLMAYKYNFVEYQTNAWRCTKIRTQKRVYSRFFRDRYYHKKDVSVQTVTKKQCEKMKKDKKCEFSKNLWKESSWRDGNFDPKWFSPKLVQNSEIWQTNNIIPDFWPYGGHWCCKWYKRTVENCYQYDTFVYKKYGNSEIMSPTGDVSHCNYTSKECQLSDGSYIMWEINHQANCEYLPWREITGKQWGKNFIASDNSIGLTFSQPKHFRGCQNEHLFMSDQGIPVKVLDTSNWLLGLPDLIPWNEWNTTNLLTSLENLRNNKLPNLPPGTINQRIKRANKRNSNLRDANFFERGQGQPSKSSSKSGSKSRSKSRSKSGSKSLKIQPNQMEAKSGHTSETTYRRKRAPKYKRRNSPKPAYVTSDHMAGALQGIWLTMSEHLRYTFEQAMQVTCNNINTMMRLLYTQILENPTLAMRQFLDSEYLVARAGGEMIEVYACQEIELKNVKFVPMEKQMCTKDIPVQYRIPGVTQEWHEGYMDPLTKQIKRSSPETDCEMVQMLPLQLGHKYYVYNANRTGIREAPQLPYVLILATNSTVKLQIEPQIIRHLKMYETSEFQSALTINQLLRAAKQVHQVWGPHGPNPRNFNNTLALSGSGPHGFKIYPMENMKYSSSFSKDFGNLADYTYQIWVFLAILYVTCSCIITCCFPEGFGARINMRILAAKIKEKYEARKQRLERQELDEASAQANDLMDLAHRTLPTPESAIVPQIESPYCEIARVRFVPDPPTLETSPRILAQAINNLHHIIDLPEADPQPLNAIESAIAVTPRSQSIFSRNMCFGTSQESIPFEPNTERYVGVIWNNASGEAPPACSLYIHIHIAALDFPLTVLWDTGAQISLIPSELLQGMGYEYLTERSPMEVFGFGGKLIPVIGRVKLLLRFNNFKVDTTRPHTKPKESVRIPHYFEITNSDTITVAILGLDFAALFTSHEVDLANEQLTCTWDRTAPRQPGHIVTLNKIPCTSAPQSGAAPGIGEPLIKLQIFAKIHGIEKMLQPKVDLQCPMENMSLNENIPTTSMNEPWFDETKPLHGLGDAERKEIESKMIPEILDQIAIGKYVINHGFTRPQMKLIGGQLLQLINILYKYRDLYPDLEPNSKKREKQEEREFAPTPLLKCSKIVPAITKSGKLRICVTYDWECRELLKPNKKQFIPKLHSLVPLPEFVNSLEGGKILSTLVDLRKEYNWHVPPIPPPRKKVPMKSFIPKLKPHSKKKPVQKVKKERFEIPGMGKFDYIQAPHLTAATSNLYAEKMDAVLTKLQDKKASPDFNGNFIIASGSIEEHMMHMEISLDRFRKAGRIVELDKCDFVVEHVDDPCPGACYSRLSLRMD